MRSLCVGLGSRLSLVVLGLALPVLVWTASTGTSPVGPAWAQPSSPVPAALDHFQCYEIRPPAPLSPPLLTIVDRYATWSVEVTRAFTLCAPADKNDENPAAPTHAPHLTSYGIRARGPFAPRLAELDTQFGTVMLSVVKPKRLLVPTAKSPTAPPAPLATSIDHFNCYRVKRAPGLVRSARITGVRIDTQFETGAVVDLVKPLRLCVPADKNGETPDAPDHADQLLCYRIKSTGGIGTTRVFTDNQFGAQQYPLSQRRELCIPARPATTSTTSTSSTSSTAPPTPTTTSTTLVPCGSASAPTCAGACPAGSACGVFVETQTCGCAAL